MYLNVFRLQKLIYELVNEYNVCYLMLTSLFVCFEQTHVQINIQQPINIALVLFPVWLVWLAIDGNKPNKHCTHGHGISDRRLSCPEWQLTELMSIFVGCTIYFLRSLMEQDRCDNDKQTGYMHH